VCTREELNDEVRFAVFNATEQQGFSLKAATIRVSSHACSGRALGNRTLLRLTVELSMRQFLRHIAPAWFQHDAQSECEENEE
jgi:hypothetical protein